MHKKPLHKPKTPRAGESEDDEPVVAGPIVEVDPDAAEEDGGASTARGAGAAKKDKKKVRKPEGRREKFLDDDLGEEMLQKKFASATTRLTSKIQEREAAARSRVGHVAEIYEGITIKDLATNMGLQAVDVVKTVMKLGDLPSSTSEPLTQDMAELVVAEFKMTPKVKVLGPIKVAKRVFDQSAPHVVPRPPVVTVMGHVDHGKTTLLDTLRSTSVAKGEAGGITQRIAAFSVPIAAYRRRAAAEDAPEIDTVTFFDTPGHAAFRKMRFRGASATDMIVLLISVTDGIQPQTIEVIELAREVKVPLIIAFSKVDRGLGEYDEIVKELEGHGVVLEENGGDVLSAKISAVTGQGLDDLLECIELQSELTGRMGDPTGPVEGVVVESRMDKGRGQTVTVLVRAGTIRVGDWIACGTAHGRVRLLLTDANESVESMGPGYPVTVVGLRSLPAIGEDLTGFADEAKAKEVVESRIEHEGRKAANAARSGNLLHQFGVTAGSSLALPTFDGPAQSFLPIIVKCDTAGSAEAVVGLCEAFPKDDVAVRFLRMAVGPVSTGDVDLAANSGGFVAAFSVPVPSDVAEHARRSKVDIVRFDVVYRLEDELKKRLGARLEPNRQNVFLGYAKVLDTFVFKISGAKTVVAGVSVGSGKLTSTASYGVFRGSELIHEAAKPQVLKENKKDVEAVAKGHECVIVLPGYGDYKPGDMILAFEKKVTPRTLGEPKRETKSLQDVLTTALDRDDY